MQSQLLLYEGGRGRSDPEREEGSAVTEAEMGVMWPQEGRQPPAAGRSQNHFSPESPEGAGPLTP